MPLVVGGQGGGVAKIYFARANDYGTVADGTTDDQAALLAANNALAGGQLFLPRGNYRIRSNLTLKTGIALLFDEGAMLAPDAGVTVTINSRLVAEDGQQIFNGASGTITTTFVPSGTSPTLTVWGDPVKNYTHYIKVTTGGALGTAMFKYSADNVTYNATAIPMMAFYSIPGMSCFVKFPAGTYVLGDVYKIVMTCGEIALISTGEPVCNETRPQWWGGKADSNNNTLNGTDSTSAIQKAINATCSITSLAGKQGGEIDLGAGCYRITRPIMIDSAAGQKGVTISGRQGGESGVGNGTTIAVDIAEPQVTVGSITSVASGVATLTGLTGLGLNANDVGQWLVIAGAANLSGTGATGCSVSAVIDNTLSAVDVRQTVTFSTAVPQLSALMVDAQINVGGYIGRITDFIDSTHIRVRGGYLLANASTTQSWFIPSTAMNNYAGPIQSYINADSVTVAMPRAYTTEANNGSLKVTRVTQPGIFILSRDCVFKDFTVVPAYGRTIWAGIEVTQPYGNIEASTQHRFEGVVLTNNGYAAAQWAHAYVHADNPSQRGFAPWPNDLENTSFYDCQLTGAIFAGFYCPSKGGQAKDILMHRTIFSANDICYYHYSGSAIMHGSSLTGSRVLIWTYGLEGLSCYNIESESSQHFYFDFGATSLPTNTYFIGGRLSCDDLSGDGIAGHKWSGGNTTINGVIFGGGTVNNFQWEVRGYDGGAGTESVGATAIAMGTTFANPNPFNSASTVIGGGQSVEITMKGCCYLPPDQAGSIRIPDTQTKKGSASGQPFVTGPPLGWDGTGVTQVGGKSTWIGTKNGSATIPVGLSDIQSFQTTTATIATAYTFALDDNTATEADVIVTARSGANTATWKLAKHWARNGGAPVLGTGAPADPAPNTTGTGSAWLCVLDDDGSANGRVRVTGAAATTINWSIAVNLLKGT